MSIPIKHHFLPEFYLQRWTTPTSGGCVFGYRRPRDRVVVKPYAPSAVGFEKNLYAIEGRTDPALKQEVESGFMSPLDARAAEALAFMTKEGRRPDDKKLRDGWTRFVMSLLYRSPERVAWLRRKVHDEDAGTMEAIAESYMALRVDSDPPNFEAYRTKMGSSLVHEAEALLIRDLIDNKMIGTHLNGMTWHLIQLSNLQHGFLTSDNPLMTSNGLGIPEGFVILPVGPNAYFMATNRWDTARSFIDQRPRDSERALNDAIIKQADKWVIGSNAEHLKFVDRRLRTADLATQRAHLHETTWKAPLYNGFRK